jgi:hypothetical protein
MNEHFSFNSTPYLDPKPKKDKPMKALHIRIEELKDNPYDVECRRRKLTSASGFMSAILIMKKKNGSRDSEVGSRLWLLDTQKHFPVCMRASSGFGVPPSGGGASSVPAIWEVLSARCCLDSSAG